MRTGLLTLDVEERSTLKGRTLYGYAAVYEQVSEVAPGKYEVFSRGAFDKVLADTNTDVIAVAPDHDLSKVLGRTSAGTLRLRSDDHGLAFEIDLPETSYGEDIRTSVERGDIIGASIGFVPDSNAVSLDTRAGKPSVWRIDSVERLRDVSPVSIPAYPGTSVGIRSARSETPDGKTQLIAAKIRVFHRKKSNV